MSHFLTIVLPFVRRSCLRSLADTRIRCFSVSSESNEQQSFTASYLMNSLGFTQRSALLVSKSVKFSDPDKPNKNIEFLRHFGFNDVQISMLVKGFPDILVTDTEKVILPKLEFFLSKGISRPELVDGLYNHSNVLKHSLIDRIIPSYEYMKIFFGSEETTLEVIKKNPHILVYKIEEHFKPNVATLQEHGVPISKIASLMKWRSPPILNSCPVHFRAGVKAAIQTGFDPLNSSFLEAVTAVLRKNWKIKFNLYKKSGLSDEAIFGAFLKSPRFMTLSVDEITMLMDLLNAEIGLKPRDFTKFSGVLHFDLKKRVIPRVSFYQALLTRGLVNKEAPIQTLVQLPEKNFLEKFVTPYVQESPELLKLYEEKVGISSGPESGKISE